jgi:hypothetical protein
MPLLPGDSLPPPDGIADCRFCQGKALRKRLLWYSRFPYRPKTEEASRLCQRLLSSLSIEIVRFKGVEIADAFMYMVEKGTFLRK